MGIICTQKYRDKQGNIIGYQLRDAKGRTLNIEHNKLKMDLANRRYFVDNLQIDKAGRLVDRAMERPVTVKQGKLQPLPQHNLQINQEQSTVKIPKLLPFPPEVPKEVPKDKLTDKDKERIILEKLRGLDWDDPITTLFNITKSFFKKSESFVILYTPGGYQAGYTIQDNNKIQYAASDFCISDENLFHIDDTKHGEICCDLVVYTRCQDKSNSVADAKITDAMRDQFLDDAEMKVKRKVNACASIIYFVESNRNLVHTTKEYGMNDREILLIEIDKHDKTEFGITCLKFLLKALGNYTLKDLVTGVRIKRDN